MLATVLHWQAGDPVVNYAMPFGDVTEGIWYSKAVRRAAADGAVTGTSATTFGPDHPSPARAVHTVFVPLRAAVRRVQQYPGLRHAMDISEYAVPAIQWSCGDTDAVSAVVTEKL